MDVNHAEDRDLTWGKSSYLNGHGEEGCGENKLLSLRVPFIYGIDQGSIRVFKNLSLHLNP